MTAFKVRTAETPSDDAFWYRMALLDVQDALVHVPDGFDHETVDAIFSAITARYDELWAQRQQVKIMA